jgi:hypothetical protein
MCLNGDLALQINMQEEYKKLRGEFMDLIHKMDFIHGHCDTCNGECKATAVNSNHNDKVTPQVYTGEMGKYKMLKEEPFYDENGNEQGRVAIGSIQSLPTVLGDNFVKEGSAVKVDETTENQTVLEPTDTIPPPPTTLSGDMPMQSVPIVTDNDPLGLNNTPTDTTTDTEQTT